MENFTITAAEATIENATFFIREAGGSVELVKQVGNKQNAIAFGVHAVSEWTKEIAGVRPDQLGCKIFINAWVKQEAMLNGGVLNNCSRAARLSGATTVLSQPVTKLIRWMAFNEFTKAEIIAALKANGLAEPNNNTVNTQAYHGNMIRNERQVSTGRVIELDRTTALDLNKFRKAVSKLQHTN